MKLPPQPGIERQKLNWYRNETNPLEVFVGSLRTATATYAIPDLLLRNIAVKVITEEEYTVHCGVEEMLLTFNAKTAKEQHQHKTKLHLAIKDFVAGKRSAQRYKSAIRRYREHIPLKWLEEGV